MAEGAASRNRRPDTRRRSRPKGYADWTPTARSQVLLDQVQEVLDEYAAYLPLTVRQIFYRLVGVYDYEKTENAYGRLGNVLVRARRARIVSFSAIRDDSGVSYPAPWYHDAHDLREEWAAQARAFRCNRQKGQPQRLELWTESAGMVQQLLRIAHPFSVDVFSTSGQQSLTDVYGMVERAIAYGGETVFLHVGDFDPSGDGIFTTMGQDAVAFMKDEQARVTPVRVALTQAQVDRYELPTAPPKASDSRTKNWSGTQTCQLEALAPDVLAEIVKKAIQGYFDPATLDALFAYEQAEKAKLFGPSPGQDEA